MKNNLYKNHWGWYTVPRLVNYKGNIHKDWFVQVYFTTLDGRKYCKQYKQGINYIHNKAERTKEGHILASYTLDKLKADWNPITNEYAEKTRSEPEKWQDKTMCAALEEMLPKLTLAPDSKKGYRLAVKYFREAAEDLNIDLTRVSDMKRSTVIQVMDRYQVLRKVSNIQYNKNLGYLKSVFSHISKYADLNYCPAHGINNKPVTEGAGYIKPTNDEQKIIRDHLAECHPNLLRVVLVLYHTGIREKEILGLKIGSLNHHKRDFVIYPSLNDNNSKTKKVRRIPINEHLWKSIDEMNLIGYNPNWYLFGSPCEGGKGNTGLTNELKQKYFLPSPIRVKRDTLTKLWHRIVKIGLGFDVDLYALKHKGADDKIVAGVSLDALRHMYGHSSKQMTTIYAKEVLNIYAKEIQDNSPAF